MYDIPFLALKSILQPVRTRLDTSPRLPIPVFRNLFFGFKKPFLTGFLRISFFSCVFRRIFSQERGFGEVAGIPVFFLFYRNFSQEFLWEGIPLFSPDSSGFLFLPKAVWRRPASD
jgi:hypothetical protein